MKYAKYSRKQYIERKYPRHGTYVSCGSTTTEKKNVIEMTEHDEILKTIETVFKNMKDAGYTIDSYKISVAFSKSCSETQDVVQVVELDDGV